MSSQVEDLRLPATVVGRIVKEALPANAAVSKEAKTAIARAASVFILNMTTYANDYATSKKRKTITAEDVYQAVKVIECDQIEKPLKEAVELWKIVKTHKAEEAKKRKADKIAAEATDSIAEGDEEVNEGESQMDVSQAQTADEENAEDSVAMESETPEPIKDIEDM